MKLYNDMDNVPNIQTFGCNSNNNWKEKQLETKYRDENAQRICVDGGPKHIEMYAFSNKKRISLDGA